ncbi:DNA mismatch repair endonuclease MutL [Methanolobus sp. WCC5]|uniref:DNA mismatch repair endonuclease MutL n=1 Tax=Methanolobus sp. WCC5 TaxID=3125785 RepID=UPI0032548939
MLKEDIGKGTYPIKFNTKVFDSLYSTPARKKYLKSARTEIAHIVDVVSRNSLAHPDVSFTLMIDGRVILRSPSSVKMLDSIVHLYGADVARSLVPVEYVSDLLTISGYISKPQLTRSGKDLQVFFINGRPISSNQISNAVRLGYYTLLPKGRYPAAFLNFTIDPVNVDVNVHPAKREVRLSHEKDIERMIITAVEDALGKESLVPEVEIRKKDVPVQSRFYGPEKADHGTSTIPKRNVVLQVAEDVPVLDTASVTPSNPRLIREEKQPYHYPAKDTQRRLKRSERMQMSVTCDEVLESVTSFSPSEVKVYGQYADLYIICEMDNNLILIDQHAAHERIMYEQVLRMQDMGWQELITPVTLDLSQKEKVIIADFIPELEKLGFSVSEFGPKSYVVTTVPSIFGKLEDTDVIHDIISDLLCAGRVKEDTERYDLLCSTMACRAAIKAGAVCSTGQMEELIRQLMHCNNPYTCPHGRPTMVTFTKDELAKMFKRTG